MFACRTPRDAPGESPAWMPYIDSANERIDDLDGAFCSSIVLLLTPDFPL